MFIHIKQPKKKKKLDSKFRIVTKSNDFKKRQNIANISEITCFTELNLKKKKKNRNCILKR